MHKVEFTGIGFMLMVDIPVHGMMEKLVSKTEGGKQLIKMVAISDHFLRG